MNYKFNIIPILILCYILIFHHYKFRFLDFSKYKNDIKLVIDNGF